MNWGSSLPAMIRRAVAAGVTCGTILELGPGEALAGLRLLLDHPDLDLIAAGYAPEQRHKVMDQARQLKLIPRVVVRSGEPHALPLSDRTVDAVFSFGSLHLWSAPARILNEIARVLKVEGEFYIGDVRRDAQGMRTWLAGRSQPEYASVYAARGQALKADELRRILAGTKLEQAEVRIVGPDVWVVKR